MSRCQILGHDACQGGHIKATDHLSVNSNSTFLVMSFFLSEAMHVFYEIPRLEISKSRTRKL